MKYTVFTAVNVVEANTRLEAVEKFCNSKVVVLLEELIQEGAAKRGHEFHRQLMGSEQFAKLVEEHATHWGSCPRSWENRTKDPGWYVTPKYIDDSVPDCECWMKPILVAGGISG